MNGQENLPFLLSCVGKGIWEKESLYKNKRYIEYVRADRGVVPHQARGNLWSGRAYRNTPNQGPQKITDHRIIQVCTQMSI
jgi:hypothetical protein